MRRTAKLFRDHVKTPVVPSLPLGKSADRYLCDHMLQKLHRAQKWQRKARAGGAYDE